MLGTLGVAAALGAISGTTKKAISGAGAANKRRHKATTTKKTVSNVLTKQCGFLGTLLTGLTSPLIASELGVGYGADRAGKGLLLPG